MTSIFKEQSEEESVPDLNTVILTVRSESGFSLRFGSGLTPPWSSTLLLRFASPLRRAGILINFSLNIQAPNPKKLNISRRPHLQFPYICLFVLLIIEIHEFKLFKRFLECIKLLRKGTISMHFMKTIIHNLSIPRIYQIQ